jgi:hypothetical protein
MRQTCPTKDGTSFCRAVLCHPHVTLAARAALRAAAALTVTRGGIESYDKMLWRLEAPSLCVSSVAQATQRWLACNQGVNCCHIFLLVHVHVYARVHAHVHIMLNLVCQMSTVGMRDFPDRPAALLSPEGLAASPAQTIDSPTSSQHTTGSQHTRTLTARLGSRRPPFTTHNSRVPRLTV